MFLMILLLLFASVVHGLVYNCAEYVFGSFYVSEWLDHHLFLGIDHFHFVLHVNSSEDEFLSYTRAYVERGVVSYERAAPLAPHEASIGRGQMMIVQAKALEQCFTNVLRMFDDLPPPSPDDVVARARWISFVDPDEFVTPVWPLFSYLPHVLYMYEDLPALMLSSMLLSPGTVALGFNVDVRGPLANRLVYGRNKRHHAKLFLNYNQLNTEECHFMHLKPWRDHGGIYHDCLFASTVQSSVSEARRRCDMAFQCFPFGLNADMQGSPPSFFANFYHYRVTTQPECLRARPTHQQDRCHPYWISSDSVTSTLVAHYSDWRNFYFKRQLCSIISSSFGGTRSACGSRIEENVFLSANSDYTNASLRLVTVDAMLRVAHQRRMQCASYKNFMELRNRSALGVIMLPPASLSPVNAMWHVLSASFLAWRLGWSISWSEIHVNIDHLQWWPVFNGFNRSELPELVQVNLRSLYSSTQMPVHQSSTRYVKFELSNTSHTLLIELKKIDNGVLNQTKHGNDNDDHNKDATTRAAFQRAFRFLQSDFPLITNSSSIVRISINELFNSAAVSAESNNSNSPIVRLQTAVEQTPRRVLPREHYDDRYLPDESNTIRVVNALFLNENANEKWDARRLPDVVAVAGGGASSGYARCNNVPLHPHLPTSSSTLQPFLTSSYALLNYFGSFMIENSEVKCVKQRRNSILPATVALRLDLPPLWTSRTDFERLQLDDPIHLSGITSLILDEDVIVSLRSLVELVKSVSDGQRRPTTWATSLYVSAWPTYAAPRLAAALKRAMDQIYPDFTQKRLAIIDSLSMFQSDRPDLSIQHKVLCDWQVLRNADVAFIGNGATTQFIRLLRSKNLISIILD